VAPLEKATAESQVEARPGHLRGTPKEAFLLKILGTAKLADA